MFPGVRSFLVFSGFGLKPLVSGFQSYSYSRLKTSPSVTFKAVPSVLASSVCWSLQCLISALTQGGGGGHFFRLTCSVALLGGRDAPFEDNGLLFRVPDVLCQHSEVVLWNLLSV